MPPRVPVPLATTFTSISRICSAVCSDTTRRGSPSSTGWRSPSASTVSITSFGGTYTPSLASTLYASSICIAVTEMPWPIGIEPIEVPE